jgi:peptidoglycan/LPS O-acetylase OafA/YrhL
VRRAFRIFPAFYAFCAVLFVLDRTDTIALRPGDLTAAMTYTMNYHRDRAWYVGHLWSLSVEEQFYLMWPALLMLAGAQRGLRVAAAVVLVAPALRVAMGIWPSLRPGIGETFPSVADALATGCVLAAVRPWLDRSARWQAFLASRRFWLVPAAVALLAGNPSTKLDWLAGQTVMNLGIAAVLDRVLRMPGDALGRLLNTRPLVVVGQLSYSLYLWQQLLLNRRGSSEVQMFPWNVVFVGLAAAASYGAIERPMLRLPARLERGRATPGRSR